MEENKPPEELHGKERTNATQRKYYADHKDQFVEYKRRYAEKHADEISQRIGDKYLKKLEAQGKGTEHLLERRERVEFLKQWPKWVRYAWRNHGNRFIAWAQFKEVVPRLANGPCDICGKTGERMDFDHCHAKNIFRGTLCTACNTAIGNFHDDPALLRAAALYLEKPLTDQC